MRTAAVPESQLTKKIQAMIFTARDHGSWKQGAAPMSDLSGHPRANPQPQEGHAQLPSEHPTPLNASIGVLKPGPKFVWKERGLALEIGAIFTAQRLAKT